jgi:chemotaxis protein MotB
MSIAKSINGACVVVLLGSLSLGCVTGCVTKGKYEDLEAKNKALQNDRDALAGEVDELQVVSDDLAVKLAETEVEAAQMQGAYDELVSELQIEVEAGEIQVEQIVNGVRLQVSDQLLFASGGATLNDKGRALLARVASQIADEAAIISVEGHTDSVAISKKLKQRYPTNWELAGARAAIVVRVLSEEGVDPSMLRAVSRGPFVPIADNATADGRARNRRTEILLRPIPN